MKRLRLSSALMVPSERSGILGIMPCKFLAEKKIAYCHDSPRAFPAFTDMSRKGGNGTGCFESNTVDEEVGGGVIGDWRDTPLALLSSSSLVVAATMLRLTSGVMAMSSSSRRPISLKTDLRPGWRLLVSVRKRT